MLEPVEATFDVFEFLGVGLVFVEVDEGGELGVDEYGFGHAAEVGELAVGRFVEELQGHFVVFYEYGIRQQALNLLVILLIFNYLSNAKIELAQVIGHGTGEIGKILAGADFGGYVLPKLICVLTILLRQILQILAKILI